MQCLYKHISSANQGHIFIIIIILDISNINNNKIHT